MFFVGLRNIRVGQSTKRWVGVWLIRSLKRVSCPRRPASQNLGALLGTPDVTIEPAGEKATIAGQRAERFRFKQTLHVPVPEGVSLPPDFPSDIELTGDLWSTDAFAGSGYAVVFKTLQAFAAIPGVEALTAGGRFPLRIALRSSIMPG